MAEHGLDQADQLAAHIKTLSPSVQQIYCSPYYRCIQTAAPTSKELNIKLFLEHGVSEWICRPYYSHSPLPASTADLAHKYFPDGLIDQSYEPILDTSRFQESYDELLQRAKDFIKELVTRLDRDQPEIDSILIVTHAATKIVLARALVGDDKFEDRTGTCSLNTFTRNPKNPAKWMADVIGDTSFLKDGEEMHWSFGKWIYL